MLAGQNELSDLLVDEAFDLEGASLPLSVPEDILFQRWILDQLRPEQSFLLERFRYFAGEELRKPFYEEDSAYFLLIEHQSLGLI
jgi:hypothetical protein